MVVWRFVFLIDSENKEASGELKPDPILLESEKHRLIL